jgi:hypothetical protein
MMSAMQFIGTAGVPTLVDGIEAGLIGPAGTAIAFSAVHQAITADGFVPASADSVATLARVLHGYSQLTDERRAQAVPQIHSLLRQTSVDVGAAVQRLLAIRPPLPDAEVVPHVERFAPGRILVQMPSGMTGVSCGKGPRRREEYFPSEIEVTIAEIVRAFGRTTGDIVRIERGSVVFDGMPSWVEVLVVNKDGATKDALSCMAKYLLKYYASGDSPMSGLNVFGRMSPEEASALPRLRQRILELIGHRTRPTEDRLGSIAVSSGRALVLPTIEEDDREINIVLPDGFNIGDVRRGVIESFDIAAIELILAAMILRFADGRAEAFTAKFDPARRLSSRDGRARVKKTLRFSHGGGPVVYPSILTPTRLAGIYASDRGVRPPNTMQRDWLYYLVQKATAQVLAQIGRG